MNTITKEQVLEAYFPDGANAEYNDLPNLTHAYKETINLGMPEDLAKEFMQSVQCQSTAIVLSNYAKRKDGLPNMSYTFMQNDSKPLGVDFSGTIEAKDIQEIAHVVSVAADKLDLPPVTQEQTASASSNDNDDFAAGMAPA